jgi:hypothetical protein
VNVPVHDVLGHELVHGQSRFEFLQSCGGVLPIDLFGKLNLFFIGEPGGVSPVPFPKNNGAVVGPGNLSGDSLLSLVGLDLDFDGKDLNISPLSVVPILEGIVGVDFFLVDVGGIRSAGGARPGTVVVVPEAESGRPQDGKTVAVQFAAVDVSLVPAEFLEPTDVRVNAGDDASFRGTCRRDGPLVRAKSGRAGKPPAEVAEGLPRGPAPDDESPKGDGLIGLRFKSPGGHLLRMVLHVLLDARNERFEQVSETSVHLAMACPGDFAVAKEALSVILLDKSLAEDAGHSAVGVEIILEQLLEPVLCLRVTEGEEGGFRRLGVNVRDTPPVAIDRCFCEDGAAKGNQDGDDDESSHWITSLCV